MIKLQKVAEHYNININELLFHVGNGTIDSDDIISKAFNAIQFVKNYTIL